MAGSSREIALFDFISHETMHLPFNEEYLRLVRAAFPEDRIVFRARAGHLANLAARVNDLPGIAFEPCQPFTVPFGWSKHNPVGAALAARGCRHIVRHSTLGRPLRLVSLLGIDGSLYGAIGRHWPSVATAPLHMILHGQLGDAMIWRPRNPIARACDIVAEIAKPLPPSARLVALELGVADAIAEIAPRNRSVITLEHPILESEWSEEHPPGADGRIRIAFLGNARRRKGFDTFVKLAASTGRGDLAFESIGIAAPDTDGLDVSMLTRKPTRTAMSREDYVAAVRAVDLVCLPLHSRAYDFTASGTFADAVSALKPLVAFRNRTFDAIVRQYGEIGWLVESEEELFERIRSLDPATFRESRREWVANLRAIRAARRPAALAPGYARLIEETAV